MISYSQNFEDVMLWRALKHIKKGFYIDVGANDPVIDSVTKIFYEHAWTGINIEPISEWFNKLVVDRPKDINIQVAAGAENGKQLIYDLPGTGLATVVEAFGKEHARKMELTLQEKWVPVRTLTDICRENEIEVIHFLKIDVEGAEKSVLEGIDLKVNRPWIIIVEATIPSQQVVSYQEWESILFDAQYEMAYFDGLNRYYVSKEHADLIESFSVPPNVFDGILFSGLGTSSFHGQIANINAEKAALLETIENDAIEWKKLEQKIYENAIERENLERVRLAERERLEAAKQKMSTEIKVLGRETASLREDVVHWNAKATENEEKLVRANVEAVKLNTAIYQWQKNAEDKKQRVKDLETSFSWRVTKPIRFAKRIFESACRRLLLRPLRIIYYGVFRRKTMPIPEKEGQKNFPNLTTRANEIYKKLRAAK